MKLGIQCLDFVHDILANAHLAAAERTTQDEVIRRSLNAHEGDSDYDHDPLDSIKKRAAVTYSPTELFTPLNYAGLYVARAGLYFKANMQISAREDSVFRNKSCRLVELLKQEDSPLRNAGFFKFNPTTAHSTGYVLDEKNIPVIALMDTHSDDTEFRDIGYGCRGSSARKFPDDFTDFRIEISKLETFANHFLALFYQDLGFLDRKNEIPPEDLTVYLTP